MADLDTNSGSDTTPEVESQPIPEQIRDAPGRDESGRFAPRDKQEQPAEPSQDAPQDGEPSERQGMVPHKALHAAREEAKALKEQARAVEAQLAEIRAQNQFLMQQYGQRQQPQPEPQPAPDWYQDPDAAFKHYVGQALNPVQQAVAQQRESFSQMLAVEKFGAEAVQAAEAEMRQLAQANPQAVQHDYQRIMSSPHPYGELIAWHKQRATLNRVGTDPDAFIQAEVERRLAEMGHQAAPHQAATPQPRATSGAMPSSFAAARNGGPRSSPQATGARSLSEIMGR